MPRLRATGETHRFPNYPVGFSRWVLRTCRDLGCSIKEVMRMVRFVRFGEKGLDLDWSPSKEQRELEAYCNWDLERLEAGEAVSFDELVDMWERSWDELNLRIGLCKATRAEVRLRAFKAARIRQRARELLRLLDPERYAELEAEEAAEAVGGR
jgi:hypothetical protein